MNSQLLTWIAVVATILGIIALALEIFVIPGIGVAGVAGIILVAWGVFLLTVDVTQLTVALVWALVITVILFFAGVRITKKFKLWQRITLDTKQKKNDGYVAPRVDLASFVGKKGTALTPLRPAGAAEISGMRLDVVTEGEYIPAGSEIEIFRVEGTRVIVKGI